MVSCAGGLDRLLFDDIWNLDVFNESDLHSAAYFYIRTYFQKNGRSNIYVRCEPGVGWDETGHCDL